LLFLYLVQICVQNTDLLLKSCDMLNT